MIRRGVLWLGIGLIAVCACFAQEVETLFSGVATFDNGLIVRYATTIDPPFADSDLAGWGAGEVVPALTSTPRIGIPPPNLQRFIVDSRRGIYFGYNLRVLRQSMLVPAARNPANRTNNKPYMVWIEPLTLVPQDLPEHFRNAQLRPAKLLAYPRSRTVGDGDSIVIDLRLASRGGSTGTRIKLSETVRFSTAGVRHLPVSGR